MIKINYLKNLLLIITIAFIMLSCSSSDVTQYLSAEDRFELGKQKFIDEDYREAISEFEIVKLQYPGSSVADDAQFYLAECHFMLEEYLLSAEEYQTLRRNLPASSYVAIAQYKTAMCFDNLSPKSELDQKYTLRAIDDYQSFIEYYPSDTLAPRAAARIKELNERLAQKLYDSAVLYMKMDYYKSATMYFNFVVEKYHDTKYAEQALLGKTQALVARKKYSEARDEINKFLDKYPNSKYKNDAESLKEKIDSNL